MSQRHTLRHRRRRLHGWTAAIALTSLSSAASAGSFDAQGVFDFANDAIFAEGFESFVPGPNLQPVDNGALEGDWYVRIQVGEEEDPPKFLLSVGPNESAYVVRAFVRSETSWYPTIRVTYDDSPGVPFTLATMYPTGRMTSDGWVEIASSPVSIDGGRGPVVELTMSSSDVDLDALEVALAPGAYVPNAPCGGLSDTCAEGQFCMHGHCQDGVAMVPTLPSQASRDLFVDVLSQKLNTFFGGVASRQTPMQNALSTLDGLRQAPNAWAFWNGVARAINELSDAHTRPFGLMNYASRGGRAFPVCLVEGDADLSHNHVPADGTFSDVLVSHVGPEKNLGLKSGDRIVAVDGQHPIAWAQGLLGHSWRPGSVNDPDSHGALVEFLSSTIPAFAATIDVIRCDGAGTCSTPESIEVVTFEKDTEDTVRPRCDHRPAYHLAQGNPDSVTHEIEDAHFGLLEDSGPGEDLYGMIWNDTSWFGGPNPWEPAYTAFRANAKGLVLDHRTGNGGSMQGATYLTELSRQTETVSVWSFNMTLGLFDQPFTQSDGLTLFNLWKHQPAHIWRAGSNAPLDDIRIAVLLARDGSGSDMFPFGVKGTANTRMFGRKTMGAFSTYFVFETATMTGWNIASGDFMDASGIPQIGSGVAPDEDMVPTQSDLIAGKDTVYERALEWVRCGDGGCP